MTIGTNEITAQVKEQAAEWLVLMSGEHSQADYDAFRQWLNASSFHQHAYNDLSATWDLVSDACSAEEYGLVRQPEQPDTSSQERLSWLQWLGDLIDSLVPKPVFAASIFLMLGASVSLFVLTSSNSVTEQQFVTNTAELQRFTLQDGSMVTLGPKSTLLTRFSEKQRYVELQRGEAFFDVVSNPDVPFTVQSNDLTVTVLGTQFDVRQRAHIQTVNVVEGLVRLDIVQDNASELLLKAGESAQHEPGSVLEKTNVLPTGALAAWRDGRLVYIDQSLSDILSDANRYSSKEFIVIDPLLANERVTLSLNYKQLDSLPVLLERLLPVKITLFGENKIIVDAI